MGAYGKSERHHFSSPKPLGEQALQFSFQLKHIGAP